MLKKHANKQHRNHSELLQTFFFLADNRLIAVTIKHISRLFRLFQFLTPTEIAQVFLYSPSVHLSILCCRPDLSQRLVGYHSVICTIQSFDLHNTCPIQLILQIYIYERFTVFKKITFESNKKKHLQTTRTKVARNPVNALIYVFRKHVHPKLCYRVHACSS